MNDYSVFFVSDHTGVTVEAVAKSVLAQFPRLECSLITLPFVDSPEKAQAAATRIAAGGTQRESAQIEAERAQKSSAKS